MKSFFCFSQRSKGFTLIEMLLAVTLFAVVMSSTVGIMRMGLQIWKRAKTASKGERNMVLAFEKMGQDIRSAVQIKKEKPVFSIEERVDISYDGSQTRLRMPALLMADEANPKSLGGYGRISYEWNSKKEICKRTENLSDLYKEREVPCQVLAQDITRFQFRYWLATGLRGEHSWYSDWDGTEGLPKAVEIIAEFKPDGKGVLPRKIHKTFLIPTGGE